MHSSMDYTYVGALLRMQMEYWTNVVLLTLYLLHLGIEPVKNPA